MEAARWQRVEAVYAEASDLPKADRERFVQSACGDDLALRDEVMSLLASASGAPEALERAVGESAADVAAAQSHVGRRIGAYRLTERIGEGGMGVVYLAERDDAEFRHTVAIKILAHEIVASDGAIARFRDERQILAELQHPGIVRLLDGGTTETGLPYLVMERVVGSPITLHARARGLGVRERIELVRQVCAALQYAHDKRVVHRDIKPSNILVTEDGATKLLDFGIAKLVDADADRGREAHTQTGAALMTPDYASPEQARAEVVTERSDVYSLGAVLYELLTGKRPLSLEGTFVEMFQTICEVDPPLPSTIDRGLAGDVDKVVLKALAKDPAHRYESATSFGDDLQRILDGEPVLARGRTLRYRARKIIRRHSGKLLAAAGMLVAAGLAATLVSSRTRAPKLPRFTHRTVPLQTEDIELVTLSRSGDRLLFSDAGRTWSFDLATNKATPLEQVSGDGIYQVEELPDGRLVISVGVGRRVIKVADPRSGEERVLVDGAGASVSPDGSRIAFVHDGWVQVHDVGTGVTTKLAETLRESVRLPWTPRWSPDGQHLIWGRLQPGADWDAMRHDMLRLTSVSDGRTELIHASVLANTGDLYGGATFSDSEHIVYCADEHDVVSIRERALATGAETILSTFDVAPSTCWFSQVSAGRIAVQVGFLRPYLGMFDLGHRFPRVQRIPATNGLVPLAFSHDDESLFSCCRDGAFAELLLKTNVVRPGPKCPGAFGMVQRGNEMLQTIRTDNETTSDIKLAKPGTCEVVESWRVPRRAKAMAPLQCGPKHCVTAQADVTDYWVFRLDAGRVDGVEIAHIAGETSVPAPSVGISPDGRWVAAQAGIGPMPVVMSSDGRDIKTVHLEGIPQGVSWGGDSDHFLISGHDLPGGRLLRASVDGTYALAWAPEQWLGGLVMSTSSQRVAAYARDNRSEVVLLERTDRQAHSGK